MSARRKLKFALMAASAIAALLSMSLPVLAQCAMCKTGVTGSPEAAKLAESLNLAILVLLIPPVLIFCGIFYAMLRQRKSRETAALSADPEQPSWQEKLGLRRKSKDRKRRESGGALA